MSTPDDPEDREQGSPLGSVEAEVQQLLGLFDAPAFARRGSDLDDAMARLHDRCDRARASMLEMVQTRLRQWASLAVGPEDWSDAFAGPVAPLWEASGAEGHPRWADRSGSSRRRKGVARELAASVSRFNRRWSLFIDGLELGPINRKIDGYNRFYVVEKECVMGSHRLAARLFRPIEPLSPGALLGRHPLLPVPEPVG